LSKKNLIAFSVFLEFTNQALLIAVKGKVKNVSHLACDKAKAANRKKSLQFIIKLAFLYFCTSLQNGKTKLHQM